MKPPAAAKKYQSYAVTVRPRDGATSEHDDILINFVKKYCEYYYVVSEKLDRERHLHGGLFFKKKYTRSDVTIMLKRCYRELDDDEKRVLARGVRIMYNMDFIDNYLDKDDETEEVCKNLPEAKFLEGYWPPTAEQQKARADKAVDKFYANLEYLWFQHQRPGVEINYHSVSCFLDRMMCKDRLIRCIPNDDRFKQTARMLVRYLSKSSTYVVPLRPWEEDLS